VNDNDHIRADGSDILDHLVDAAPQSEVVAVSFIAEDRDVAFS
jgi:hypothetical protein